MPEDQRMDPASSLPPALQHLGPLGYGAVLLLAAAQTLPVAGLFVPGSALLVLAGIAAAQGMLGVGKLIGFAAAGAILGDGLSFWLGAQGKRLFHPDSRWFDPARLAQGRTFFRRHGNKSVFLGRVVGPIRGIVPLVAGLAGMDRRVFLIWNVVSGLVWATAHVLTGYLLGDTARRLGTWTTQAALILLPLVVLGSLIWSLARARRRARDG
jgi:membrane protein DedA with SNARE-associated domain